jgi:murein L,D-transpeptidase YcbB/YkuD
MNHASASEPSPIAAALERRLAVDVRRAAAHSDALAAFYGARDFAPLWIDGHGLTARGRSLVAALKRSDRDGLDPGRYATVAFVRRLPQADADGSAAVELALGAMLLRLAADLRLGTVRPRIVYFGIAAPRPRLAGSTLLSAAETSGNIETLIGRLAPTSPGYARLKASFARYRAIAARGGWPEVRAGPKLVRGATDPRIPALRRRLAATGDLANGAANGGSMFDQTLDAALRRFQARHGLNPDGALGPRTLAALNVAAAQRVARIRINLERHRWIPDEVVRRAVMVNAAAFELDVVEAGRSRLSSRIIVGKCSQKTPRFATMMTGVRFNPYWRVPPGIARFEILPRLRRDPGYLARHRIRVLSDWGGRMIDPRTVDWKALRGMPYKLRQEPGPGNALGRIRFLMPNRFNVYLHDTPAKRLFERRRRTFSHGCIRVQKPAELAAYLLRDNLGWSLNAVQKSAASRIQRRVYFVRPLPVFVGYLTAWVDETGHTQFREDVYGLDPPLLAALRKAKRR